MNSAVLNDGVLFPRHELEVERPPHLIKPTYCPRGISNLEFDAYITFIEQILRRLLPQDLIFALSLRNDPRSEKQLVSLLNDLPLLFWNNPDRAPCTLCVSLLCQAEFIHGVGRYVCDSLSQWLIPGKFLNICSVRSLKFRFISSPDHHFFFHQVLIDIENDQQLAQLKINRDAIEKEVRLSILAVRRARNILSIKKLSPEQKRAMIEESLDTISRPLRSVDNNIFDQMQNFWVHISSEDKIKKLREQFSPYIDEQPKFFDRDIFHEIKHSILLLNDKFAGIKDLRHASRLISYQYLFRKTLMRLCLDSPEERHLSLKLIKNAHSHTIGIVGAMNVLRENELFEERHILEAISHCLPSVRKVENSFILDRRSHDPVRFFYLEIEKTDGSAFSLAELVILKKNLPHEFKESVESILHPVLMPRNEEEIMRNILLLSQQLKYLNDLPQVIISFNAQTEEQLQFTVILLRVLREDEPPLKDIFAKSGGGLVLEDLEVKRVGLLRKRYPKEANVFKVSLDKKQFLRKDYTIDLFKARQWVSLELNTIFNGIRDFNGGILSKQQEVFQELRSLVADTSSDKDFLLENFFYSITPPLRQTLIKPARSRPCFLSCKMLWKPIIRRSPSS